MLSAQEKLTYKVHSPARCCFLLLSCSPSSNTLLCYAVLCCSMVSRPILYHHFHHNLHCIVRLIHSIHCCLTLVQTLSEIFKSGYSRIPVYGVDRHDIIGLILTKDLIFLDADVSIGTARIAASPLFSSLPFSPTLIPSPLPTPPTLCIPTRMRPPSATSCVSSAGSPWWCGTIRSSERH